MCSGPLFELRTELRQSIDGNKSIPEALFHYFDHFTHFKVKKGGYRGLGYSLDELSHHRRAQFEHLEAQYLAQGYLGSPLKVLWHLPILPKHLPWFVCTKAWTENTASHPVPQQTTTELPGIFFCLTHYVLVHHSVSPESLPEECQQCHALAECVPGVGCQCKTGFQGNGTFCIPEPRECTTVQINLSSRVTESRSTRIGYSGSKLA